MPAGPGSLGAGRGPVAFGFRRRVAIPGFRVACRYFRAATTALHLPSAPARFRFPPAPACRINFYSRWLACPGCAAIYYGRRPPRRSAAGQFPSLFGPSDFHRFSAGLHSGFAFQAVRLHFASGLPFRRPFSLPSPSTFQLHFAAFTSPVALSSFQAPGSPFLPGSIPACLHSNTGLFASAYRLPPHHQRRGPPPGFHIPVSIPPPGTGHRTSLAFSRLASGTLPGFRGGIGHPAPGTGRSAGPFVWPVRRPGLRAALAGPCRQPGRAPGHITGFCQAVLPACFSRRLRLRAMPAVDRRPPGRRARRGWLLGLRRGGRARALLWAGRAFGPASGPAADSSGPPGRAGVCSPGIYSLASLV